MKKFNINKMILKIFKNEIVKFREKIQMIRKKNINFKEFVKIL